VEDEQEGDAMIEHDPISVAEGERRRDAGHVKVLDHEAAEHWAAAFEDAVVRLLVKGRRRITSEDVIELVGPPPHNPNAVGAVMRAAAVRHNLRNVGTVKAARVARHAGRITVWERQ
jgi:hypothetical protein